MISDDMPMDASSKIEPRVARLEANVESIAAAVRSNTEALEGVQKQIKEMLIAVTTAAGPRKTDWALLLGAIGLFMAIGTAALSPMYIQITDSKAIHDKFALDTKQTFYQLNADFEKHRDLHLHPVGNVRINSLEATIEKKLDDNDQALKDLRDDFGNAQERLSLLEQRVALSSDEHITKP